VTSSLTNYVTKSIKKTIFFGLMLWCTYPLSIIAAPTQAPKAAVKLNQQATKAFRKKHYLIAIKKFESLLNQYPFITLARRARIKLTYAYYVNDDAPEAYNMANTFLHLYPQDQHADYMLYIKALSQYHNDQSWLQKKFSISQANLDQHNLEDAYKSFKKLVLTYPNSPYAPNAVFYLRQVRNALCNKDYLIARYYFKSQQYVASTNRCMHALKYYQGSPYLKNIKHLLAQNYQQLKLTQQTTLLAKIKAQKC
jgi:outer membrane protein assembly factor BamD